MIRQPILKQKNLSEFYQAESARAFAEIAHLGEEVTELIHRDDKTPFTESQALKILLDEIKRLEHTINESTDSLHR